MAFILFETGSGKWLKSRPLSLPGGGVDHELMFTSNHQEASAYNDVWTREGAIKNLGAEKWADTIIRHSLDGRPIDEEGTNS